MVVFVLNKVLLKQNKSHSKSLDLHLVFINEGLPEIVIPLIGCYNQRSNLLMSAAT